MPMPPSFENPPPPPPPPIDPLPEWVPLPPPPLLPAAGPVQSRWELGQGHYEGCVHMRCWRRLMGGEHPFWTATYHLLRGRGWVNTLGEMEWA